MHQTRITELDIQRCNQSIRNKTKARGEDDWVLWQKIYVSLNKLNGLQGGCLYDNAPCNVRKYIIEEMNKIISLQL